MKDNWLSLETQTPDSLNALLDLAESLKAQLQAGGNEPLLRGKALAMLFMKPSLRTRVSFEMGMEQLGGHALYLSPDEVGLGKRESVADVARVLSRFVDGIMARVFAHDDVVELAKWASIPVINGLSDYNHPCQGLTDLLTIREKLGYLKRVSLAYVGDGNNMTHTLMYAAALTGMRLTIATPPCYEPLQNVVARALELAKQYDTGATITVTRDCTAAVYGAQVLYTDTWTSMGQEEEEEERLKVFPPYQINAELLSKAAPDAKVMHCLPAHRGQEITDEIADGADSWLFDQAENRLHAQKAILVTLLKD